eukprot:GILJ01014887.1.p1 GENE.GILJ01014887.1~~GILJ01014887.1.p1  ORF type:complete len:655 (-),score=112.62 GILJ01014887.1:81-2045(-)
MGGVLSTSSITYGVEIPDTKKPGETNIYRSSEATDRLTGMSDVRVTTLYDNFLRGVIKSENRPFLGVRTKEGDSYGEYKWMTYGEAQEIITHVASAMINLELCPVTDSDLNQGICGFYATNSREWVLCEQACNMMSIVTVPLYDTLGKDSVSFIIKQTEMQTVCCTRDKLQTLFRIKSKCPSLENIILLDKPTGEDRSNAEEHRVRLFDMEELIDVGRAHPVNPNPPSADHIATFCYTSGTTGDPKGVMLSHGNMTSDVAGVRLAGGRVIQSDVHLSYLPLAHVLERMVHVALIQEGARIGFLQSGNVKTLMDDIQALRPTIFAGVPRVFDRFKNEVLKAVASQGIMKKSAFELFRATKLVTVRRGMFKHLFLDRLIFNQISAKFGGRIRLILSGAAPLSPETADFFRVVFSCPVIEGYGATECGASCTLSNPLDVTSGHVGGPVACNELKLVDVPELSYFVDAEDGAKGEVCVRGLNVFRGYYKDDEKTKESLDEDGWLKTGDIAQLNPNGSITLIDRKKNVFKLAHGEYVAGSKLEDIYSKCESVKQIYVHGDSKQAYLVAVVVPKEKAADNDSQLRQSILQDLNKVGKANGLQGFEMIKNVFLTNEEFTLENELLTPTLKVKRFQVAKKYSKELKQLYEEGPLQTSQTAQP